MLCYIIIICSIYYIRICVHILASAFSAHSAPPWVPSVLKLTLCVVHLRLAFANRPTCVDSDYVSWPWSLWPSAAAPPSGVGIGACIAQGEPIV